MKECIFCKSKKVKSIQRIKASSIIDLYNNELNIDISEEFLDCKNIDAFKCNNCKLLYFDPIITGSENFYEGLQHNSDHYYSNIRPEFLEAKKNIGDEDLILEIGSGSAYFAEMLNNKNYVGLEYNQEAIDKAKKRGIHLEKKSIEDFSKDNVEKFDIVCSFHVLEHVSDPYSFIESSLKTLKKGGKLICAVPCSNSYFTSNLNHVLNMPPHHVTRWEIDTMDFLCTHFNLKKEYFYNDKVDNVKGYFEFKTEAKIFKFLFLSDNVFVNNDVLIFTRKIIKKATSFFRLNKIIGIKEVFGKNMILVATKM